MLYKFMKYNGSTIPLFETVLTLYRYKLFWRCSVKKRISVVVFSILVLPVAFIVFGCASGPKLGSPTTLQQLLNDLPEITVAGKDMKFEFGGDVWIAKVDGKEFMAGTVVSEDIADGSNLTLKQTHLYSSEQKPGIGGDVGWVKTPGPDISLVYKKGPPETLTTK
jgi:hypothetical protein